MHSENDHAAYDNPPSGQQASRNLLTRRIWYCAIIVLVTAIAFSPVLHNGFTNFDDDLYVTANQSIRGFTPDHIVKQFSSSIGYFHPVTMLTLMADYSIFGLHPTGYHITSLLFHLLNCLIVFALIVALTKSDGAGFLAAMLFAVHPLRVESVAWIAERKDVVSSLFFFASLWAYVKFLDNRDRRFYLGCLALFVLSLLSKPMAVSLPLVLLLIDYLKGHRVRAGTLVEKWPFFAVAALFSLAAYATQSHYGALSGHLSMPVPERVALPFYGILFYVGKTIAPVHLCAYYPYNGAYFSAHALLYPFLGIAAGIIAFFIGRRSRQAAFGLLFYLVTLLPVLQIVPIGRFIVAERYSYVPMVGIYYLLAIAAVRLFSRINPRSRLIRGGFVAGMVAVVALLGVLTWQRCGVWKDSASLWTDALATHPSGLACVNLGSTMVLNGRENDGILLYQKAVAVDPDFPLGHLNLGGALLHQGKPDDAITEFREALRTYPDWPQAHNNLATALLRVGQRTEALDHFQQAVDLAPDFSSAHSALGLALLQMGRSSEAITHLQKAAEIEPENSDALAHLGQAYLLQQGNADRAIACFRKVLSVTPADLNALNGLTQAFLQAAMVDSALAVAGNALTVAKSNGQEAVAQAIERDIANMQNWLKQRPGRG